jgi:hypothetical protein
LSLAKTPFITKIQMGSTTSMYSWQTYSRFIKPRKVTLHLPP